HARAALAFLAFVDRGAVGFGQLVDLEVVAQLAAGRPGLAVEVRAGAFDPAAFGDLLAEHVAAEQGALLRPRRPRAEPRRAAERRGQPCRPLRPRAPQAAHGRAAHRARRPAMARGYTICAAGGMRGREPAGARPGTRAASDPPRAA